MLALFTALIGPYFIDWTSYRAAFEQEATRALGQTVTVRGDADARLLPFPSLTFSDVAIGADDNGQPLMTVDRFSMDAELAPFLRGEILIFDMRLERPSVTLRIRPDGQLDWALRRTPSTPGETVVLEKVSVSEADIRIIDEQNNRSHYVQSVDAVGSAKSLSGPWHVEGTARILGMTGAFMVAVGAPDDSGKVRLRTRLRPDGQAVEIETEGDGRIIDGKPRYDGGFVLRVFAESEEGAEEAPSVAGPKTRAIARGNFEADNERLRIPDYRLSIGGGTDPYVVTGEATVDTGPEPDFLLTADGQQVDVNRIGAEETNGKTGRRPVSLPERLTEFTDFLAGLPPPPLPGRIDIALPAIVAGDTTIRDIAIAARPADESWQIDRLVASLPGRTRVEADGLLQVGERTAFSGNLLVVSNQPSGLANWLSGEVDPVLRRITDAGFSAKVSLTPGIQRFERLELAVGAALLKGSLERQTLEGQPPSLSLDLKGDRFDVDAVRALSALAGVGRPGEDNWLGAGNLSARVEAEVLSVGGYDVGGVAATVVWRDGMLTLDRVAFADLGGASGTLSGALSGSLAAPSGSLAARVEAAAADRLMALISQVSGGHAVAERLRVNGGGFDPLTADIAVRLAGDAGPEVEAKGVAAGSEFEVKASGTGLLPARSGPVSVAVTARNPEAWRLAAQAGFAVLPLDGSGAGELAVTVEGDTAAEQAIEAEFSAGETRIAAKGTGRVPADGPALGAFDVTVSSPDIEPAAIMFGQAIPQAGTGLPVEARGRVALEPARISVSDLVADVAGNAIEGDIGFDRQSSTVKADGALKLSHVDLGWLGELALGPGEGAIDGGTWSNTPFLPPSPGAPSLSFYLAAETVSLAGAGEAKGLTARLVSGPGLMTITEAAADYLGGRLAGEVSLNNPDGTAFLSGRLILDDVDFAAVQTALTDAAPARARASLETSIEGTGASPRELVAALSGAGALKLDGLVIEGLNSSAFAPVMAAAEDEAFKPEPSAVTALATETVTGGEIALGDVTLPFTLSGGSQRFSAVTAGDGKARLSAEGRIDLTSMRLESLFTLIFDAGREALAGAEPAVTIGLDGLIADPARSIDASALTNYLSMHAFERERRKVELLQAGVIEKQRMRRELGLVAEAVAVREREAQQAREAEAARLAAERAQAEAAAAAAREAEERAAEERRAAQRAAEAAARQAAEAARKKEIERQPIAPPAPTPAPAPEPLPESLPRSFDLDFDTLPGVPDPAAGIIPQN